MSAEPIPTQPAFRASPDIFTGELDGMLVVLDLRSEAYYILDEVATTMWRLLVERGERAAVLAELSARYDADPALLARDLDALIARLIEGGFGAWGTARAPVPASVPAAQEARGRARRPSALRAWWWLARTVLRLRREGFAAAYRHSAALAPGAGAPPALGALLDDGLRAFARAENLFLIRRAPNDCFPRSIALFGFLRELGVPVEHHIGVDRFPFRAHAWVEYAGRVLADHAGQRQTFTTIARIAG